MLDSISELKEGADGILVDLGGGNGRNLVHARRTLIVLADINPNLLQHAISEDVQKVAFSLPHIPMRLNSVEQAMAIAAIHHLRSRKERVESLRKIHLLLCTEGVSWITLWRKWRPKHAKLIFERIRRGEPYLDLVDHERPWKDAKGNVISTRFYHYYTTKEVIDDLRLAEIKDYTIKKMGGKSGADNLLITFGRGKL